MKRLFFPTIVLLSVLASCYSVEDAADVNQERIQTFYHTEFNATRATTQATLGFRFGQTPLKVSNPIYFEAVNLREKKDIIAGLHYTRKLDGLFEGEYEWTDETGQVYFNQVPVYAYHLQEPVTTLKKYTYYKLPWEGDQLSKGNDDFVITVESHVDGTICSFNTGDLIEIHSDHLINLPTGAARLTISRNYSETIDDRTPAGGESKVAFVREYEIEITE